MEMQTENSRNSLTLFRQLLALASGGQPITPTRLKQQLAQCQLTFQDNELSRGWIFPSDSPSAIRLLQKYVHHCLKRNANAAKLVDFLILAKRLATNEPCPLLGDVLHFPIVLIMLNGSLAAENRTVLNHLDRLITNSINTCHDWPDYIDGLCTILRRNLDAVKISGFRSMLNTVLRSNLNETCTDEPYLTIVTSVLKLGSRKCQTVATLIIKLSKTTEPNQCLSLALHLTFLMRQSTRVQICRSMMRLGNLPATATLEEMILPLLDLGRSDIVGSHGNRLITEITSAAQRTNRVRLLAALSELCDLMDTDPLDKYRNDLLLTIMRQIGSNGVSPTRAVELGLSLTAH